RRVGLVDRYELRPPVDQSHAICRGHASIDLRFRLGEHRLGETREFWMEDGERLVGGEAQLVLQAEDPLLESGQACDGSKGAKSTQARPPRVSGEIGRDGREPCLE